MSLRFYHRFRIFKGLSLNVSKRGMSATIGQRGAHLTLNTRGETTASAGIVGSGLSWRQKVRS